MLCVLFILLFSFFFFIDPATTLIYTLSLHDALPIYWIARCSSSFFLRLLIWTSIVRSNIPSPLPSATSVRYSRDRKSTRLNSSHLGISYAVFCLKKKKNNTINTNNNKGKLIVKTKII